MDTKYSFCLALFSKKREAFQLGLIGVWAFLRNQTKEGYYWLGFPNHFKVTGILEGMLLGLKKEEGTLKAIFNLFLTKKFGLV